MTPQRHPLDCSMLAIPSLQSDFSTRSYLSLVQSSNVGATAGVRTMYEGVPMISFTSEISDILLNEITFWGQKLVDKSVISIICRAGIFLPSIHSHSPDKTAYPPQRNIPFQPFILEYAWNSPEFDADFEHAIRASAANIRISEAIPLDQTELLHAPNYPNYAALRTPLKDMYGDNVPALHALRRRVDPTDVMALAGGWKF